MHFYKINKDTRQSSVITYKKKANDNNNSSELKTITVNFNL